MSKTRPGPLTVAAIVAVATFLFAIAAFADTAPTSASGGTVDLARSATGQFNGRKRHVNCDQGATLKRALKRARPGDELIVHGTCYESVSVTTDRIAIRGKDNAAIDGSQAPSEAVVHIEGARGVELANIEVRNGSDQGVLASHGAQAKLDGVSATGNGTVGLSVDGSGIVGGDLSLTDNGQSGMDAYAGSTVVLAGAIAASGNQGDGLQVNGKSYLELRGATVDASNNGGSGVSIVNDSRLQVLSFPEAQGSGITADGNGFAGIGLLGSELAVVGSQFFGSGANVFSATNNLFGFFLPAGGILSPHATARFVANGNVVGMLAEDGARAIIIGGLDLNGNNAGLSAVGAGTLSLVSVPPNPSRITGNFLDVELGFGTRATIDGVDLTSLICDGSVLLRGTANCP